MYKSSKADTCAVVIFCYLPVFCSLILKFKNKIENLMFNLNFDLVGILNNPNEEFYHPSRYGLQNRLFITQIKKIKIKNSEI